MHNPKHQLLQGLCELLYVAMVRVGVVTKSIDLEYPSLSIGGHSSYSKRSQLHDKH